MKKTYLLLISILIIFFAGLFSSCDYLLPAPLGRNNPYDTEAQIGRFAAVQSGANSLIVAWDWRDIWPGTDPDREIVEIILADKQGDYPISMLGGSSYSKDDGYSKEFNNLNYNSEYYFSLYAKEKSGIWLRPVKTRVYLGDGKLTYGMTATIDSILYASNGSNFSTSPLTLDSSTWALVDYSFSGYNVGAIIDGSITLDLSAAASPSGDIWIVPLRARPYENISWDEVDNSYMLDMDKAVSFYIDSAGTNFSIPIKDILNLGHLYGSNAFALIPNSTTGASFDISSITVYFDFWENN